MYRKKQPLIIIAIFLLSNTIFSQSDCDPISTFPWTESFEHNGTELPLCWNLFGHSSAGIWNIVPDSIGTPSSAVEGNYKARVASVPAPYTKLFTPVFDLSMVEEPVLNYWHALKGNGNIYVYYRNSSSGDWILLQFFHGDLITIPDWQKEVVHLPNKSSHYQIEFRAMFPGIGGSYEVQLDNIKIMEFSDYADATLSSLTAFEGELEPVFSSDILNYSVNVANIEEITITATPTNPSAMVNGTGTFLLEYGQNVFPINIIAEDGETVLEYTITVNRDYNIDATLSHLSVSEGMLAPEFTSAHFNYAVEVEYYVTSVILSAIPNDVNATIIGDGVKNLNAGTNTFKIIVTAEDEITEMEYTIVINKLLDIRKIFSESDLISIYPNPTKGELTINNEQLRTMSVEVFDVYGRKQKISRMSEIGKSKIEINIAHLSAGIYFVKVGNRTMKVVKK